MASLVAPLVSGISGAASGSAEFFRQGTSTLAAVYSDFEGVSQITSHALDAYGAVVRYVEERVDVVVRDSGGATVRSFSWGTDARESRLENLGFTGPDASGQTIPGGRTTVDAAFSRLFASLGATDGLVDVNGTDQTLTSAVSSSAGVYYNVKSPAYGAVGDGVANDSAAIQAAINAASAAGGGIVFFPPGTYAMESVSVPIGGSSRITLLGGGASNSVRLTLRTSGTNSYVMSFNTTNVSVQGLGFYPVAASDLGYLVGVSFNTTATFRSCTFGNLNGQHFRLSSGSGTSTNPSVVNLIGCEILQAGALSRIATGDDSTLRLIGCDVTTTGANLVSFDEDLYVMSVGSTWNLGSAISAGITSIFAAYGGTFNVSGNRIVVKFTSGTLNISSSGKLIISSSSITSAGATVSLAGTVANLYEAGCTFGSNVTIGAADTGYSASRSFLRIATSNSATSYSPSGAYATHEITSSGASMATNNRSPDIPAGWPLTIVYKNTSGATITPTFGSAYSFVRGSMVFDTIRGVAAAGPVTSARLLVGDVVETVPGLGPTLGTVGEGSSQFETTITVNGQIQQTAAVDLTGVHYLVVARRLVPSVETGSCGVFMFIPRLAGITTDLVCVSVQPLKGSVL